MVAASRLCQHGHSAEREWNQIRRPPRCPYCRAKSEGQPVHLVGSGLDVAACGARWDPTHGLTVAALPSDLKFVTCPKCLERAGNTTHEEKPMTAESHTNGSTALAPSSMGAAPVAWDAKQRKLIRDTFASGASDEEFAALMAVSERRGLDPFKREIYFVKRWDNQKRCEVWATQVSIDGLRLIAERSGKYDGQDEPEFVEDETGLPVVCKVRVYRKDWSRPVVGVAHWAEYVQTTREGKVTSMWNKFKHVMLAKCAEALAMRKAFPESTAGLYIAEEMSPEPKDVEGARVDEGRKLSPDEEREGLQQVKEHLKAVDELLKQVATYKTLDGLEKLFAWAKAGAERYGEAWEKLLVPAFDAQREKIAASVSPEKCATPHDTRGACTFPKGHPGVHSWDVQVEQVNHKTGAPVREPEAAPAPANEQPAVTAFDSIMETFDKAEAERSEVLLKAAGQAIRGERKAGRLSDDHVAQLKARGESVKSKIGGGK